MIALAITAKYGALRRIGHARDIADTAIAVVAPLIRAGERAKVRAELLAIAAEMPPTELSGLPFRVTCVAAPLVREIADRIAPDPKETT